VDHVWRWAQRGLAITAGIGLLGIGVLAASISAARAGQEGGLDVSFTDPVGDATNGAPDVTSVRVGDSNRVFTFTVSVRGVPAPETRVDLYIDADRDKRTGDSQGRDYWLLLDAENLARRGYRWSGSSFVPWSPGSRSGGYQNGIWTESVSSSDLGGSGSFNFFLAGIRLKDDQNYGFDATALFSYSIGQQQPTTTQPPTTVPPPSNQLAITSLSRKPKTPTAGEDFTVSVNVQRIGRAGRFNGTVSCTARITGRAPHWFGSVQPGRAACRWAIPANAAGKAFSGTIGVSEGGPSAVRRVKAQIGGRSTTLAAVGITTAPPRPEPGKQFYYALGVSVRAGNAAPQRIQSGTVACLARVGNERVGVFEKVVRPLIGVRCGWLIPFGSSGKTLVGSITVRSNGGVLVHPIRLRIR
jgi:hypothetical protein